MCITQNKKDQQQQQQQQQNQEQQQNTNVQNELLLQITEQLSNLKDHFASVVSGGGGSGDGGSGGDSSSSFINKFVHQRLIHSVRSYGKMKSIALFTLIILFFVMIGQSLPRFNSMAPFSSTSNDDEAHGSNGGVTGSFSQTSSDPHQSYQQVQSELAKMNSLIYAQQNNFFQLHLGSKELQTDLETQKSAQLRFMGLYMRNTLNAAFFARESIADGIDSVFAQEMVHRKMGLERKSGFRLINLKQDAYKRLHSVQKESLASLTVANTSQFLEGFLDEFKEFQRDFKQQISVAMATAEYLMTHSFQQARRKMAQLVARENDFTGFEYEDVRNHLAREQEKLDEIFQDKISEASQEKYKTLLKQEYATLNKTYQDLLATALEKYATDITYERRFSIAMETLENVDLGNGKYVWRMNSSLLPTLPGGHGFYSEKFTAIPSSSQYNAQNHVNYAKLWLLRTSAELDLWKVTYEQFAVAQQKLFSSGVRVEVTILNQSYELDLDCAETYREQKEEKRDLVVDFDIPLTRSELERRGYIQNGNIYVRAIVVANGDGGGGGGFTHSTG